MAQQDDAPRPPDAGRAGEADAGAGGALLGGADDSVAETPPGGAEAGAGEALTGESDAGGEPHETRVAVWGTPATVERGKRFAVRVGVACPSKCPSAGWVVEVRDHAGEQRGTATLGDEPWSGTDALHHAEVALVAPDAEGLHTWEAGALTDGLTVAHAAGRARFGVRVVSAPDCLVTVAAVDGESGAPVEGARVVAHPYRTVTDASGVAELRVPAGEYRLFVSGKGCIPFRFEGEVTADMSIRAELEQDRELSDADIWS